jgi:hypothetical protein
MENPVCGWPIQRLRVAFFDFTQRGEGDSAVVAAVIARWHELGELSEPEARRWHDILLWRDTGHALMGWSVFEQVIPSVRAELSQRSCCSDVGHWRGQRTSEVAA